MVTPEQQAANDKKGQKEIVAEMQQLRDKYKATPYNLRGRAMRQRVREEMESRYRGDGRILTIIYWVLKFALLFLLI